MSAFPLIQFDSIQNVNTNNIGVVVASSLRNSVIQFVLSIRHSTAIQWTGKLSSACDTHRTV